MPQLGIDFKETQLWNFHAKQRSSEEIKRVFDSLSYVNVYNKCIFLFFFFKHISVIKSFFAICEYLTTLFECHILVIKIDNFSLWIIVSVNDLILKGTRSKLITKTTFSVELFL